MLRSSRTLVLVLVVAAVSMGSLLGSSPALGAGTQGGFAVAVSADGSRLVAGGSNRVLYDLDPTTLAVKRRVLLGRQIMKMAFSTDGTVLVVESTKAVQFLRYETLEPFQTLVDAQGIAPVPALDAVAIHGWGRPTAIRILSMTDATEVASVPYDRRQSVGACAVSQDGTKLALLYARRTDAGEEKVAYADIPDELKKKRDAALREYQQRHDGYSSRLLVFDVKTGETLREHALWYGPPSGGNMLVWQGDDVYVVGYHNQNAKIDAQGEVTYFELANSYNYALAATLDGSAFWTGGLRTGTRTRVEGLQAIPFEVDELQGFPEYFKAFSVATDGTAFAGTSAFRVARLSADGTVVKVVPVY